MYHKAISQFKLNSTRSIKHFLFVLCHILCTNPNNMPYDTRKWFTLGSGVRLFAKRLAKKQLLLQQQHIWWQATKIYWVPSSIFEIQYNEQWLACWIRSSGYLPVSLSHRTMSALLHLIFTHQVC